MKLTTKSRVFVFILLAVVVINGRWFLSRLGLISPNIRQIILISIDTCRADYLSCYGYPRRTTPNIDAIAQQAVLFEQVITPVPLTLPAHSSMLTGTIPPYHGVRNNLNYKFREWNTSVAEILREHDYRTGAIISAFVLDAQFGLNQGFETYNDDFIEARHYGEYMERKAQETSEFACRWLEENRDEKFFLFLHYFDPHDAYVPPEPFASRFADNLYAGEIAYTDDCIGRVIEKLKALGLYDSSLIIIVSDHGEGLGQHAEETHGYFIYQSTVRVPLIFKLPGGSKPSKVSEPVAVIDIAPTILRMLRVPVPAKVQGRDLSGLFTKKQGGKKQKEIYCESIGATQYGCNPLFGVVQGRWKYIETTKPELYDIVQDPDETKNLVETETRQAKILQDRLKHILSEQGHAGQEDSKATLDQKSLQRLASLGYVGGGEVSEEFNIDLNKEDPKDLIGVYNLERKYNRLFMMQQYDEAEKICRQILKQRPDYAGAHRYMGEIAMKRDQPAEAAAHLAEALRLDNSRPDIHEVMAVAMTMLGRLDEAYKHHQEALRIMPDEPKFIHNFGTLLAKQGKPEQAIAMFKKALEIDPDYVDAYHNLGNILAQQGKMNEAANYWRESLRRKPGQTNVLENLGKISYEEGKMDEAIEYLKKSIQVNPQQSRVYFNLGLIFSKKGDISQATEQYLKVVQLKPDHYQAHINLANLLAKQGKTTEAIQHWKHSLEVKPEQAAVHQRLGIALVKQDKVAEAVSHFRETVRLMPNQPGALRNLAWILSTYRGDGVHNPNEAIQFAEHACELTNYKDAGMLDTLATAYAAAEQFDKAVTTAQKAVDLALSSGQERKAEAIRKRLELYQAGQPYYQNP